MALAFTAGFTDAVGYLQAGIFAANMTGNTVLVGISVAQGKWMHAAGQAATIAAFFVGALTARMVLASEARRASVLYLLEATLLLAAAFVTQHQTLAISLIAAGMGIQATAITRFDGAPVSTVVVTSTIARFAEVLADRFRARLWGRPTTVPAQTGALLAGTWCCYLLGAVAAGLAAPYLPNPLALAAASVLLLSLLVGFPSRLKPGV